MRIDRLMAFAWKFLIPLSIANVLLAAVWLELVLRLGGGWKLGGFGNWLVGVAVTGLLAVVVIWPLLRLARTEGASLARTGRMAEARRPTSSAMARS
jgi:NADH-quinone oxidoreductase subunit H